MRTIPVDDQDVAVAEEAKAEIIRQMKSMEGEDATVDSPISVAVDMDILRRSANPEDRQLADLLAAITELRTSFASLEKRNIELMDYPIANINRLINLNLSTVRRPSEESIINRSRRVMRDHLNILNKLVSKLVDNNLNEEERLEFFNEVNALNELMVGYIGIGESIESDRTHIPSGFVESGFGIPTGPARKREKM